MVSQSKTVKNIQTFQNSQTVQNGPIASNIVQYWPNFFKLSKIFNDDQKWSNFPKWSRLSQNIQIWSKMIQYSLTLSKSSNIVRYSSKSSKIDIFNWMALYQPGSCLFEFQDVCLKHYFFFLQTLMSGVYICAYKHHFVPP